MSRQVLPCSNCKKDIIGDKGLIVFVKAIQPGKIMDVYGCCHGECEELLKTSRVGKDEIDFSLEISDMDSPQKFAEYVSGFMDRLYEGLKMDPAAYRKLKRMMTVMAYRVFGWEAES
jgi:hypothetical protein